MQEPWAMAQPPHRGRELCEQPAPISGERWHLVDGLLFIVFHLEPRKRFSHSLAFNKRLNYSLKTEFNERLGVPARIPEGWAMTLLNSSLTKGEPVTVA